MSGTQVVPGGPWAHRWPMSSHAVTRILHTNPASDERFRAAAERELHDGALTASELEDRLRDRYPNVSVHYRGLAQETDGLYLFREGRWTRDVSDRSG